MRTPTALHAPQRPSWDCGDCREPWPCSPARVGLGETYAKDRVGLAVYMGMQLEHAAGEIGHVAPKELWERFLAWTRPHVAV